LYRFEAQTIELAIWNRAAEKGGAYMQRLAAAQFELSLCMEDPLALYPKEYISPSVLYSHIVHKEVIFNLSTIENNQVRVGGRALGLSTIARSICF
jgi:hypothetical protein